MSPKSLRAGAALMTTLFAAMALAACSSDEPVEVTGGPNTPAAESSTIVTSTVAAPSAAEGKFDDQVAAEILDTTWGTLHDTTVDVDLSAVLTAAALEEFENQRLEWMTNEWHQEGKSEIVSSTVEVAPNQLSATAQLCIDSSGVTVLDENGVAVNQSHPDTPQRTLTVASFVNDGRVWKLSEQQIADDPNC